MMSVGKKIEPFKMECYMPATGKIGETDVPAKADWTILFFYPGDFTFVCPTELEELARVHADIRKAGAELVSISTDGVYVHKGWIETEKGMLSGIRYAMASDRSGRVSRMFGCYDEASGTAGRMTAIIDANGVVRSIEAVDNNIGRGARELVRKLKALKYVSEHHGEVCVASWEMGMPTLKPGVKLSGRVSEVTRK